MNINIKNLINILRYYFIFKFLILLYFIFSNKFIIIIFLIVIKLNYYMYIYNRDSLLYIMEICLFFFIFSIIFIFKIWVYYAIYYFLSSLIACFIFVLVFLNARLNGKTNLGYINFFYDNIYFNGYIKIWESLEKKDYKVYNFFLIFNSIMHMVPILITLPYLVTTENLYKFFKYKKKEVNFLNFFFVFITKRIIYYFFLVPFLFFKYFFGIYPFLFSNRPFFYYIRKTFSPIYKKLHYMNSCNIIYKGNRFIYNPPELFRRFLAQSKKDFHLLYKLYENQDYCSFKTKYSPTNHVGVRFDGLDDDIYMAYTSGYRRSTACADGPLHPNYPNVQKAVVLDKAMILDIYDVNEATARALSTKFNAQALWSQSYYLASLGRFNVLDNLPRGFIHAGYNMELLGDNISPKYIEALYIYNKASVELPDSDRNSIMEFLLNSGQSLPEGILNIDAFLDNVDDDSYD